MAVVSPGSAFSPSDDWDSSPFDHNQLGQRVELCSFKSGANPKK